MNTADKDALHAAIMNLPCDPVALAILASNRERIVYAEAHRDARHAAADLVASHPAEMMDTEVQTAHPVVGLPCKDLQTAPAIKLEVGKTYLDRCGYPRKVSREVPLDEVRRAGKLMCRWFEVWFTTSGVLEHHNGDFVSRDCDDGWRMENGRSDWRIESLLDLIEPTTPGESAEAVPSNEKAPAVGVGSPVSTAMEVLRAMLKAPINVLDMEGHFKDFSPEFAALLDHARTLVSAAQERVTK